MKVLFIRHGESMSQVKQIQAGAPDYLNGLIQNGIDQIKSAAKSISNKINAVYASPHRRTVITARTLVDAQGGNIDIIMEERLREINYGFHVEDTKKHPEMIEVSMRQIAGDYEIRFGRTGENKREIVTRFFSFLIDVFNSHKENDVILAISHGRAISILNYELEYISGIQKERGGGTKNASIKEINLTPDNVKKMIEHINSLNSKEIEKRRGIQPT
ncbi:MAG: histidine phosphatase family protein [Alphaproteobacteria bacterium]|nr:histidine phosphatase family protein [Alphaproteobacteria bacterium]